MAHLDLDTTDLRSAALHARDAAGQLAGAHLAVPDATSATGDATLAHAVEEVLTAWAPAHRALLATMQRLADALTATGETFENAERVSAGRIAEAILSTGDLR